MDTLWKNQIPDEYLKQVIMPVAFELHADSLANAERIIGYDSRGAKCYDSHSFKLTDECFDIDEFPVQVDVYYERTVAWRLRHGQWLKLKRFSNRLDQCNKQFTTLPLELAETEN